MNNVLSREELQNSVKNFLKEHIQGSLATVLDGVPRSSPVLYFFSDDFNIYIVSAGGEKFKAIEKNNNVCLLVNTEYLDFRRIKGVQIFGKAQIGEVNSNLYEEGKRVIENNNFKLRGDEKIIKIVPDEIIYLDSTKTGDRTKQILKMNE
ncbi:Pyridoxamine 5'-phosphate oxidase [Caloramator mitchellensis]|uniref:Pyridoxamine 5'-phosphate oxidase n=1 Tax=Caloramator mitchellensis TaxID=908809 RepID=A0A0R3K3A8_CALMK|nr:pyridoxamine 5'-phosphate oxidase family protein [Caloramator mitchellensis]KRQ87509.1 Pyridoxamine 5'-phosphate oxidase [Caloramator mitchellensis]